MRFDLRALLVALALAPTTVWAEDISVRIELVEIWCDNTEDVLGGDEFFVTSALKNEGLVKTTVTKPIDINDGETKLFMGDQVIIFDAKVAKQSSIVGGIVAFDEDFGMDWKKKHKEIAKNVDDSVSGIATSVGGSAGNIVAAISKSVYTVVNLLAQMDEDDKLGELELNIPADGPAEEILEWTFEKPAPKFSNWKYKLKYKVIRNKPQQLRTSSTTALGPASGDSSRYEIHDWLTGFGRAMTFGSQRGCVRNKPLFTSNKRLPRDLKDQTTSPTSAKKSTSLDSSCLSCHRATKPKRSFSSQPQAPSSS
ncbi:hypothetical protein FGO68_gene14391 [Halteria grandinella]|uniref:Uncharacterized protein n=1 Tax=Halteria grandinella TaxID=5974 RepID=A0A8J8NB82_HALGN|nr:hypothetical protein FGO68_gene14391 [Halteria grandinella]